MAEHNVSEVGAAPRYVTCLCQYCSGKIEFDACGFDDGETRTVECPHCQMDTIIFVPRTPLRAEASKPLNLPPPRAVPPTIPALVVQDNRARLKSLQSRVNNADLFFALGLADCVVCFLLGLGALCNTQSFGWFFVLTFFGVATGIPPALYGHARAKKLRPELFPLFKKAEEEQAMRDAAVAREKAGPDALLAREKAAQMAAFSASPEDFAKCLAVLRLNGKTTPSTVEGFIGQDRVKAEVEGAYQATRINAKRASHILLVGSQGMGTTTLALLFARAFSKAYVATYRVADAQALRKIEDFAGCLTNLDEGDFLFLNNIDEFTFGPLLKSAMLDFTLDVVIDQGPNSRSVRLNLPHFTLIATAMETVQLSPLLVASFPVVARFDDYRTRGNHGHHMQACGRFGS